LSAIYPVLSGIISGATAALAKGRPAQINITLRNPPMSVQVVIEKWQARTALTEI
jgi:hypothetical protein